MIKIDKAEAERLIESVSALTVIEATRSEGFQALSNTDGDSTAFVAGGILGRMEEIEKLTCSDRYSIPAFDVLADVPNEISEAVRAALWQAFRYGYYQALSDSEDAQK